MIGFWGALLCSSGWFASLHLLSVSYLPVSVIPVFLVNTLTLGLACGYLMLKTDSIWGAVLIHAGADLFLFIALLAAGCQLKISPNQLRLPRHILRPRIFPSNPYGSEKNMTQNRKISILKFFLVWTVTLTLLLAGCAEPNTVPLSSPAAVRDRRSSIYRHTCRCCCHPNG